MAKPNAGNEKRHRFRLFTTPSVNQEGFNGEAEKHTKSNLKNENQSKLQIVERRLFICNPKPAFHF